MIGDEVRAEEDSAHLDGIGRSRRGRDRSHERFVGPAHVRVHHIEVALVDRRIHRLAYRAAGVVQPGGEVSELHEVAKILQGAVAPAPIEVGYERRAVRGSENGGGAADAHAARGITRVLNELAWCRAANDLAGEPRRHVHPPLIRDGCARFSPQPDRFGISSDLEADFREQPVGVPLDGIEPLR